MGVATRPESSPENNYVVTNLFVTIMKYGSRLQRLPLPPGPSGAVNVTDPRLVLNAAKVCSAAPTANGVTPKKARRFKVVLGASSAGIYLFLSSWK